MNVRDQPHSADAKPLTGSLPNPSDSHLKLNKPEDSFEKEADQISKSVLNNRSDTELFANGALGSGSLRHIRVHTDDTAANSARAVNALAFTAGLHIVFGRDQFAPHTQDGRRLLTHELAHALWQPFDGCVRRKEIPVELLKSIDPSALSEKELHDRYDLIASTLADFGVSSGETAWLEEESGRIGAELSRRALAAGRTFDPADIENMKNYFISNTKKKKPRNCIDTLNDGLQKLYRDKKQMGGDAVNKTMGAFQAAGRAGEARVIEFEDKKGKVSPSGAAFPFKVHESVWEAVIQMAEGDIGWSVFGMGPADMSHSVTLTLDNTDPAQRVIYWSDQWKEKGGWKKFDKAGLDAEVAKVTQIIWNKPELDEFHKPSTKVTLWRLKRNVDAAAGPVH